MGSNDIAVIRRAGHRRPLRRPRCTKDLVTDLATPTSWFDALYGTVETGWVNLWAKKPQSRTWWHPVDDLTGLADDAARIGNVTDLWFGVGIRAEQLRGGERGGDDQVLAIPALWLDIDITDPDHHKTQHVLPPDLDAGVALAHELGPAPSALIATGGGIHAWWFLDEPLDHDPAAALLDRWGATWTGLSAGHGWHLDNTFDLARVMRVPGTRNHKSDPARPVHALEFHPERRHAASDIDELLHDPVAPTRAASSPTGATTSSGDRPGDAGQRPGDQWNATADARDDLERTGWTHHHDDRGGDSHWTRPGKDRREGSSATVFADNGRCTVFTDAIPTLPAATYDPWGLHVHLRHAGDFTVAAKDHRRHRCPDQPPAPPAFTGATPSPDGAPLPVVVVNARPLADVTADVLTNLEHANEPPIVFLRAGELTKITVDENQRPALKLMGTDHVRYRIARTMRTVTVNKDGDHRHVTCPLDVVKDLLVHDQPPFPPLEAITELPILRPDGTIHACPGYDPATRRLHLPAPGLQVPLISDQPGPDEIAAAVQLLVEDLLGDFPFETDADRANALGLLLTPIIRSAIPGQVPLALVDAPEPGTGKGLLANVTNVVATGRQASARPLAGNDDEVRKMLTAVLLEGPALIVLDNIEDAIRAPSLAAVLTTDEWADRLLGRTETVTVPNRATWVATGNNLAIGGDIGRRCYRIRLDAHQARPYTRTGFRHPDLLGWTLEHRGELVAALLTLARAWWNAGRPLPSGPPTIGGFTPWAHTIAGILHHAGITEFLANLEELHASLDIEGQSWETFLTALREEFVDRQVTSAEIATSVEGEFSGLRYVVPSEISGAIGKPTLARRIGEAFRKREGRRHGSEEIAVLNVGLNRNKTALWSIVPMRSDLDPSQATLGFEARGARGHAGSSSPDAGAHSRDTDSYNGPGQTDPAGPRAPRAPENSPSDRPTDADLGLDF